MPKSPISLVIATLGNYTLHFSEENGVRDIEALFEGDTEIDLNDKSLISTIIIQGTHNVTQTYYAKSET